MKFGKIKMLGIAIMTILSSLAIPFTSSCSKPEVTMARNYEIPPIDAEKPAVTETATFALG